ncbi:MAG: TetR/AcrR family transcriptional regulator [Deltaproteobacteria bacterium]|nr:TetR/AcrR family transcriptional regulator [Deltaproteobacteria bacterium]
MSRKEMILRAATRLFSAKGFKETSMAELSRMSGVAGGTIFYHFKNKEELFLSILEGFKSDIVEEFERYRRERKFDTGLDMIEGTISFYFYLVGRMEDRFLLLHRHDAYELAEVNPLCGEYLQSIYNCLLDIFEQAVQLGQKDGSIAGMPARKTAMIILCMVDGLARFNTYKLYDAGALYNELMQSCRRMLQNNQTQQQEVDSC